MVLSPPRQNFTHSSVTAGISAACSSESFSSLLVTDRLPPSLWVVLPLDPDPVDARLHRQRLVLLVRDLRELLDAEVQLSFLRLEDVPDVHPMRVAGHFAVGQLIPAQLLCVLRQRINLCDLNVHVSDLHT